MRKILIVGNPNCGKTTLINMLTGENLKTGNWNGVTVNAVEKNVKVEGKEYVLCDLPGIYSINGYSQEEKVTSNIIKEGNYDLIINVIEASKLKRSLSLTKELLKITDKVVILINMHAELKSLGGKIDVDKLRASLGCGVFDYELNDKRNKNKIIEFSDNDYSCKNKHFDISETVDYCYKHPVYSSGKIQKLFLNNYFSVPIYTLVLVFVLYLAFGEFGLGSLINNGISYILQNKVKFFIKTKLFYSENFVFFNRIFCDALIDAFGSVLAFIPQILILNAFTVYMDECGILSRIAYSFHGILSKFGISGKSVFCLFSGFGCTAIGESYTAGLDNFIQKEKTALILPMFSCGAKTTVYYYLISTVFKRNAFLIIMGIYALNILSAIIYSWVISRFFYKNDKPTLLMEIPIMRRVGYKKLVKSLISSSKEFIIKIGTTVLTVSLAVYILGSVDVHFNVLSSSLGENCILAVISKKIINVFAVIGIKDWQIVLITVLGLFAKENIVGAMVLLYPNGLPFSNAQIISYLLFCVYYTPCIVALKSTANEIGILHTAISAVFQFLLAYYVCILTYHFLTRNYLVFVVLTAIITVASICLIKFGKRIKCMGCKYEKNCFG